MGPLHSTSLSDSVCTIPSTPLEGFQFFYRSSDPASGKSRVNCADSLLECFGVKNAQAEEWVFVDPHPDDSALAFGLLLQAAHRERVHLSLIVVSDGQLGYRPEPGEDRDGITLDQIAERRAGLPPRRREEAKVCYDLLGIKPDDITF